MLEPTWDAMILLCLDHLLLNQEEITLRMFLRLIQDYPHTHSKGYPQHEPCEFA